MIDINKKYKYRDGSPARILCVDRPGDAGKPVISMDEIGAVWAHTDDGYFSSTKREDRKDLIEVIPLWEGEIWVHKNGVICKYDPGHDESYIKDDWRKVKAREVES